MYPVSVCKRPMRRLLAIVVAAAMPACSSPKKPAAPDPHIPERLTTADALVRAGCYDCLVAAYREYTTLRVYPSAAEAATAGAVRSAALLAARERELGTEDSGYLQRAHELVATNDTLYQQALVPLLEITRTLLTRRADRQIRDDIAPARMQTVERLEKAYTWRPRWPAVTTSIGNSYVTLEEFEQAVTFFDRTLAVVAAHPDALLGKIKALTYAGRYADSLATIDRLLALERWY